MPSLDVRTAVLCAMATRALLALALVFYGSVQRTYPGFRWWTAGAILGALGFGSLALRPVSTGASILLVNGLSMAGVLLILDGTLRFTGDRHLDRRWYVLPLMVAGINFGSYFVADNILFRQLVFTLPTVGAAIAMAVALLRGAPAGARPLYRGAALLELTYVLVLVGRMVEWSLDAVTPSGILEAGNAEAIFYLFLCAADLASLTVYLMLNGQRLEADLITAGQELRTTLEDLRASTAQVKLLSGILPICSQCKKIRDSEGHWHPVEGYVRDRTDADFSHSMCPDCLVVMYPQYADVIQDSQGQREG